MLSPEATPHRAAPAAPHVVAGVVADRRPSPLAVQQRFALLEATVGTRLLGGRICGRCSVFSFTFTFNFLSPQFLTVTILLSKLCSPCFSCVFFTCSTCRDPLGILDTLP